MKIGNHVGSLKGKCVNKALPAKVYGMPRIETTAECDGDLAGKPVKTLATYQAEMRSDGTFIGDCPNSGVVLAADIEGFYERAICDHVCFYASRLHLFERLQRLLPIDGETRGKSRA